MRLLVLRLEVRALVGGHPEPVERGDDPVGPLGSVACLVGVLNPQDEGASVTAGEEPVVEGGPGAADVEDTRWARARSATGRVGWPSCEGRHAAAGSVRGQLAAAPVFLYGDGARGAAVDGLAQLSLNSGGGFSLST